MFFILVLSLVFLSIGAGLLMLEPAKIKRDCERKWLNDNVWKDAKEWEAYQSKRQSPSIDLFI